MKRMMILLLAIALLSPFSAEVQTGAPRVIPPDLEPITANNIDRLERVTTFGFGLGLNMRWSPDGRALAITGEAGVWLISANQPQVAHLLDEHEIEAWMLESPLYRSRGDLDAWGNLLIAQADGRIEASFSADGTRLAEYTGDAIRVWDAHTRQIISLIPVAHNRYPMLPMFSPDNRLLMAGVLHNDDNGTDLVVWDANLGQEIAVFPGHYTGAIFTFAINPAGTLIAAGDIHGTIGVWNITTGELLATYRNHFYGAPSLAFTPDGSRLASGGGLSPTILWDVATGQQIMSVHDWDVHPGDLMFVDDETLIETGQCGALGGWNITTGEQIRELGCKASHKDGRTGVSPDGRWIVGAAEFSPVINVWDVATDTQITELTGHTDWVIYTEFSPDGSLLASASCDGTIRLWDTTTWEEIAVITGHEGPVWSLAFSPDSRLLVSASSDGTARLWYVGGRYWDTCTGTQLAILYTNQQQTGDFLFSPDGRTLVTSACQSVIKDWDERQCSLVFWDVASVQPVRVIQTEYGWITLTFNPTGTLLAMGTASSGIELWGVPAP